VEQQFTGMSLDIGQLQKQLSELAQDIRHVGDDLNKGVVILMEHAKETFNLTKDSKEE